MCKARQRPIPCDSPRLPRRTMADSGRQHVLCAAAGGSTCCGRRHVLCAARAAASRVPRAGLHVRPFHRPIGCQPAGWPARARARAAVRVRDRARAGPRVRASEVHSESARPGGCSSPAGADPGLGRPGMSESPAAAGRNRVRVLVAAGERGGPGRAGSALPGCGPRSSCRATGGFEFGRLGRLGRLGQPGGTTRLAAPCSGSYWHRP